MGRKRFLAVDSMGLPWARALLPARHHDRDGAMLLIGQLWEKGLGGKISKVLGDGAFGGKRTRLLSKVLLEAEVEVPCRRGKRGGFVLEKGRWVVERSFAWLRMSRRLVVDHERTMESSQGWMDIALMRIMLRRL